MNNVLTIAISAVSNTAKQVIENLPSPITEINYVVVVQLGYFENEIHRPDIKVVLDDKVGVSRSRNLALANSESDFTLFSDDDIKLNAIELSQLVQILKTQSNDCFLLDVELKNGDKVFKYDKIVPLAKREALLCWAVRLCLRTNFAKTIGFNEKISIGTDIPLGEETIFTFEAMNAGKVFFQIPLAPAKLTNESHSGDRITKEILRAKGIISAHIWHGNILFYTYNLIRCFNDVVLSLLRLKSKTYLYKYFGIILYLTRSEIRERFVHKI